MAKLKVSVEQPYFFPYLGYFQIINYVDKYVVFDDVNYIKRGWANRNYILVNGTACRINIPVNNASQNKLFNETQILSGIDWRQKLLRTIETAYRKAPYFNDVYPILCDIINNNEICFSNFIMHSLRLLCCYMKINTELVFSSEIDKNCSLKAEDRIIDICKTIGATEYINSIGGISLYHHINFERENMDLHFFKISENVHYKQFNNDFVPNLSIIDVMMFNSIENIQRLLTQYTLV